MCGAYQCVTMKPKYKRLQIQGFSLPGFILSKILGLFFIKESSKAVQLYRQVWKSMHEKQDTESSEAGRAVRPFRVRVPEDVLQDLKERLARTLPEAPSLPGDPGDLRAIATCWLSRYRWGQTEEELNAQPQFRTGIEGCDVHFVWVGPNLEPNSRIRVIPLLMIHGFPGSCSDFLQIIPRLTRPRKGCDFVFEVVCVSLPRFGFSESNRKEDFGPKDAARILVILMERIGIAPFYVHGRGWGSITASLIARYYPYRVKGLHTDRLFSMPRLLETIVKTTAIGLVPFLISSEERGMFSSIGRRLRIIYHNFKGSPVVAENSGCAALDCPVGFVEMFCRLYCDSCYPGQTFCKEEKENFYLNYLLPALTVSWINNDYYHSLKFIKMCEMEFNKRVHEKLPLTVPCGMVFSPDDPAALPRCLVEDLVEDLVTYTILPRGSDVTSRQHALYEDLWKFVKAVEKRPACL